MSRPLAVIVASLAVLVAGAAVPGPASADEGLVIASHTVYEVQPDAGQIAVAMALSVTNVVPDTPAERTYYTGVTIPIPAGASGVSASSNDGVALTVEVAPVDELSAAAEVRFSRGVYFRESYALTVRFVVTDSGGDPERETWVRSSFVAFPIWTAGEGPASVEVLIPAAFEAWTFDSEVEVEVAADVKRLVWSRIADPASFFAYVVAEREVRRTRHELDVAFADRTARIVLHAWPDDPEWSERQADVLGRGLPLLEAEIGVPYPIRGTLNVSEHAYRHLGDYAGWFIEDDDTIEMRFDADPFTTLHEAAHVWMNGSLADDRWLLEGFASYYAEIVGTALGEELVVDELTDDVARHAFPLLDWGRPMLESADRERYGYAASLAAAREIAAATGPQALQRVWNAALSKRPAYAIHADERRLRGDPRPEEWQRMLDLLENESGASLGEVWDRWVLDATRAARLDERIKARERYEATVDAARPWVLPAAVRRSMEGWDFAAATEEMTELARVITKRQVIAARTAALGLTPTDRLRLAFERTGAAAANQEADAQEHAIDAIANATDRLASEATLVQRIGLLGERDPHAELAAARAAFEDGRNTDAARLAQAAAESGPAAVDRGRARIGFAGAGILLADLATLTALLARRGGRRQPVASV